VQNPQTPRSTRNSTSEAADLAESRAASVTREAVATAVCGRDPAFAPEKQAGHGQAFRRGKARGRQRERHVPLWRPEGYGGGEARRLASAVEMFLGFAEW
jgi:hypothetical protein